MILKLVCIINSTIWIDFDLFVDAKCCVQCYFHVVFINDIFSCLHLYKIQNIVDSRYLNLVSDKNVFSSFLLATRGFSLTLSFPFFNYCVASAKQRQLRHLWLYFLFMFCLSFWHFAPWLVTQDLHKSHNDKTRSVLTSHAYYSISADFEFQNITSCEIMWKIKHRACLYICECLDTGVATFVKHDVTSHATSEEASTNDTRRDFQDRLFSSGFWNITELILLTSYAS